MYNIYVRMCVCIKTYTVLIYIKAGLIYIQGLKYTPGSAAE